MSRTTTPEVRTAAWRSRGPAHAVTSHGACGAERGKAALIVGQREKPAMACLGQEQRYGLCCGKSDRSGAGRTLYHVKLTDSAIRALEAHQNVKVPFVPRRVRARARVNDSILTLVKCVARSSSSSPSLKGKRRSGACDDGSSRLAQTLRCGVNN